MDNGHGNRGKWLERNVLAVFRAYDSRGIFCQQIWPKTASDGTIVAKAPYDFECLYNGRFVAFDAKECHTRTWSLDNAKLHQVNALAKVEKNGGEGFFLVFFHLSNRLVKVPVSTVTAAMSEGRKSLTAEDGIPTTINILEVN